MNYHEVVAYLDDLQMHKIKLGLEAMQGFLARVGGPEKKLRCIHVAGTNGKGSVCATAAEILGNCGYRVGIYTSPHLSSVRERFRIGRDYIDRETFARVGERIIRVLGEEQITYFEFTTALALLWFEEQEVDFVLLETGMGGRLDATNVVLPLVSVITSISMDHEIYLGDSIEAIAAEKAGIIKQGVPVVAACSGTAVDVVIEAKAKAMNAPLFRLGREFDAVDEDFGSWIWKGGESFGGREICGLRSSRASLVQKENDTLAITTVLLLAGKKLVDVTTEAIHRGVAGVDWPGRMEYVEIPYTTKREKHGRRKRLLFDGAHNPAGVENLARTLKERFRYRKLIVIWGAMADKDIRATLETIGPMVDTFVLTSPEGERSASPDLIAEQLRPEDRDKVVKEKEVDRAVEQAMCLAGEEDLVLVAGSLYLLGEVRAILLGELV